MVTYAKAGVNRKLREKAKRGLKSFELTYKFQKQGKIIKTALIFFIQFLKISIKLKFVMELEQKFYWPNWLINMTQ